MKKLTNHTARKIAVKKKTAASVERQSIAYVTGHASEKSLYNYDEGNDSGQEPLASLHSQLLLEVSQVYQDMWSFPATSSTCEQVNTSDHNFTTVKSGVIYSSPTSVDQNSIDCS